MNCAGVPGLEPRMAVPETDVLPITPYPNDGYNPQNINVSAAIPWSALRGFPRRQQHKTLPEVAPGSKLV